MRSKLPYTPVKFYYDIPILGHAGCRLKEGCYIVSEGPRATAAYWVQSIRPSKKIRGRFNLTALRWPREEIPAGACVHTLTWYPRKARTLARRPKFSPLLPAP